MNWAYGVTTVPSRLKEQLPATLCSLFDAGFPDPRLFVDGCSSLPEELRAYETTFHKEQIKANGNWTLALWELYLRNPAADRYAIFQDDVLLCKNLRKYLDSCKYPKQGYLNLYTFPDNQKLAPKNKSGWYLSNQQGKGALGLIFSNEAVTTLLQSRHFVFKCKSVNGDRSIDGNILSSMKATKWREYVHSPSLVQHMLGVSAIGNKVHPMAPSFPGTNFDAATLIPPKKEDKPVPVKVEFGKVESAKQRIGLIGFNCASGLGEKNRQLNAHLTVEEWAIVKHKSYPLQNTPTGNNRVINHKDKKDLSKFLDNIDILLFDETPYNPEIIRLAKRKGKRIVCILCMEWLPEGKWTKNIDLFICPTKQCYDMYCDELPCTYFPWPVDTERFKFKPRQVCKSFLFLNGNGGWNGRKGASVVKAAKLLWPDMPLFVRSQKKENWPRGTIVLPPTKENYQLYEKGDVLLCPHAIDGTGLEPMEAAACGMPVVSTDGLPWNEIPAIAKIQATITKKKIRREMTWYKASPESLVEECKQLLGHDISLESKACRAWATDRSFIDNAWLLNSLILKGK